MAQGLNLDVPRNRQGVSVTSDPEIYREYLRQVAAEEAKRRKDTPIFTGALMYFPLAIAELARVSKAGNDQHNPGKPLHWAREKSTDHLDCAARHLIDSGPNGDLLDTDGQLHLGKVFWRTGAKLQLVLEARNAG